MSQVILLAGMCEALPAFDDDLIGIDHGAIIAMRANRQMIAAIGDFDSVSSDELKQLETVTKLIKLNTHKNETDSEAAINYAQTLGYDEIILYGGLGGRIDHELINLSLLVHKKGITLMNERNRIRLIEKGSYKQKKEYHYLSFIPLDECVISLKQVAYPLDHCIVHPYDTFTTSNEILDEAEIIVHEGRLLMIECNDEIKN